MLLTKKHFKSKTTNQKFYAAILLISAFSLGLTGCSGVVSGKSGTTNPPPPSDTTPPTVSITSPAASATVSGNVNVTANATDNVSVASVQFKVDGANTGPSLTAAPYAYTWNTTTFSNANHSITAVATDGAGNSTTSAAVSVKVDNTVPDTTPPTVSISAPASGSTVTGTVNVTANASDNVSVASVQFQLDGANVGALDVASPYSYSWNTTTASNGSHTLRAIAKDAAGNSATSAAVTVTVSNTTPDTTPPTVSVSAPANGATVSGTVSVTANASDNVGVASVQFQLDSTNVGSLDTTSPYAISWNTTTTSNGSHTLRAIARDAAGNSTTSAGVTVTVNNSSTPPPTVSIASPASGATVSGTITVSATASSSAGVANVQFLVDGANFGAPDTAAPYTISLDTTALSNGNHTLSATAQDTAGKATTSAGVTVAVSNAPPPPPPPGSTVTSFQLTSPVGGTLPFTVGLGFKKGDVPNGASLSVANSQVVVKRTWSDGSIKHAIASGFATLTASTPLTVNVLSSPSASGTNLTASDIQAAAPSASIQCGSVGTVNLSSLLATPFRTWISGPQMVEAHYRSQIGSDPTLVAWFHVRLYKGGRMWVRAIAQNGYLDVNTNDKTYTATVIIGGTAVFNGSVANYANTRWSAEGWIGGDPQITPKHDTLYLETTKLVPNYMNLTPSSSALSGLVQTYTPMSNGPWNPTMGDTGFQDQIGILPKWDALYLTSKADPRAYAATLAGGKAINSYPIVWDDSTTQLPTQPSLRPTWTVLGAGGGGSTSWNAGPLIWDVAHHPSAGYVPYIITGDYYYLESMEDNASMCYLLHSSSNGSGQNRIMGLQTRSLGWCLRTFSQLAGIGPTGDAVVADYAGLLSGNITKYNNDAQQPGMNQLGLFYSYEVNSNSYGGTTALIAPWMHDFVTQALGHGLDLEPLSSMTAFNQLRTYADMSAVGRLGGTGSANYCFTEAAQYNLKVANTTQVPPTQWYPNWGTLWTANFGSPNTSCANTLHGSSGSNPVVASTGYWGNLMPAIAYAVDHGASGAATAWTRLTGASNWSTVLNSGFGDTPNWGIVPRSGGTTPPPPPPTTTVSVTAPAAGATVSGTIAVQASASSSSGIAGVQFRLDSSNLGAEVTAAPYSTSWNTTTSTDGMHFLSAVARDALGNLTAGSSVSVTVSNTAGTPPLISAVSVSPSTSGAIMTWTTDRPATSQVEYGTTTAYGNLTLLDSSLVTSHSVTLGGLTASTVYQFRVHSTDSGGNAAVSGNFSFTTLVQPGGGIPPSLGWYQIPNTTLSPNCPTNPTPPGNTGCSAVIIAWNSAVADTLRNRLIIWGGGDLDYAGNEVYALDLINLTMKRITNPSNPVAGGQEVQPDGQPDARHTYYGLAYIPTTDEMFSQGGSLYAGGGTTGTWTFKLSNNSWTYMTPTLTGTNRANGKITNWDYDPVTGLLWGSAFETGDFLSYNRTTNSYTIHNSLTNGFDYHLSGVIDPVRKLMFFVGNGQFWKVSIASGSNYAMSSVSSSGCGSMLSAASPGLAFDSAQNLIVGWGGGSTVYQFNPDTNSCTAVTYSGGPGAQVSAGTFGRFRYFPALKIFVLVDGWQQNAFTLRLTP